MLGPTIESAAELEQRDSKFKIDTIIISFNINFRYESWILRIKDKIIVPRTQSIKFIDKSSWIKLRQIRELIGLLTLTKQLTNWSNNERNNTIQLSRTSQQFIFLGHFVKLREFTKLIHELIHEVSLIVAALFSLVNSLVKRNFLNWCISVHDFTSEIIEVNSILKKCFANLPR